VCAHVFSLQKLTRYNCVIVVSFSTVAEETRGLVSGMARVKKALSCVTKTAPHDRFLEYMQVFHDRASVTAQELDSALQQAQSSFAQQAARFGEDEKQMSPEQLFTLINNFTMSLLVCSAHLTGNCSISLMADLCASSVWIVS